MCVAGITALTTVAVVKEGSGAAYVGVFAILLAATPICLVIVIDIITIRKRVTALHVKPKRHRKKKDGHFQPA